MNVSYEKSRTGLEQLIAEMQDARRDKNSAQIKDAKKALLNYCSDFDDLNEEALNAHDAACIADLDAAISEFSKIARRVGKEDGRIKTGLEGARKIAQSGKKELLIPKVAEVSTRVLSEFKELKDGIRTLIDEGGDVHDLQSLNNILPDVITTLGQLKTAAGTIGVDVPDEISDMAQLASSTLTKLQGKQASLQEFIQTVADVEDLEDVADLLPEAISRFEQLKQAAKDAGIGHP